MQQGSSQLPTPIQSRGGPTPRMRRRFAGIYMLELSAGGAHGPRLPPAPPPTTPGAESGKLDPSDTADQMSEGDKLMVQSPINVSPVTGGYRLPGWINGTKLSLLLDTGAAVTLLREDVWRQLAPQPPGLEPWPGATLVSAGGMPLGVCV